MVLTAPGIPLGLSAQTPTASDANSPCPMALNATGRKAGGACGEGSILPTQALEAGNRQASGHRSPKLRSEAGLSLYHPNAASWANIYYFSPTDCLPSILRPLQPQNHHSTQQHSSEPAAHEHPCVEAPEGLIPLIFTHPGQICN